MERRPRSGADFDELGNVWDLGGPDDQPRLDTTTAFISKHVDDPRVVVECGALRGALTVRLLDAFPRAALHLVEIAPSHAAVLRERFAGDSRVNVHEADMLELETLSPPSADAVLLIECLYYLDHAERRAFVEGLQRIHGSAKVIVSCPITGGVYFTERELRGLFDGYRLVGVDVVSLRGLLPRGTSLAMRIAGRLRVVAAATRILRRRVADHAIYAFVPTRAIR